MRKWILALLWLCCCYSPCISQVTPGIPLTQKLDQLVTARLPAVAPGCAILIAKNGRVVYKKAFGSADLELQVTMRPDMIFRLGSITKQYTAIAILQLVEQGKIHLQDSIQQFITSFPYKGHTITIENLLTHTSGIIDYETLDIHIPYVYRIDFPPKQIIDSLGQHALEFIPGSQFSYCNSNYFLLGYILEILSGKSYAAYMQQHIFTPAGLTHTYYDNPKQLIPNRVNGYAKYGDRYEHADYIGMSQVYAAGALMSNVEDLFKWHQALYAGKLVKRETLQKACTPYRLTNDSVSKYGYGWFIKNQDGAVSIEHAGGIDGFQSDEIYLPGQDIFIATLYNSLNEGGNDMRFMNLSNDIATLARGKALAKEIRVPVSVLQQYTGVYAFDSSHTAIITLENGQLQVEAPAGGLPKSPLAAENDHTFLLNPFKAVLEFVKDKSGHVTQLIVHSEGRNDVCQKIQ